MTAAALLTWFDSNARKLPWRESDDPYAVLVCEVMSQQTRIQTVLEYWARWMQAFPTIDALAAATTDEVLTQWAGLGYYRRARNLHACAQRVAAQHGGVLPHRYEQLLELPGVGPYTAAAVASIVYNEPVLALDGNVARVASRYGGIYGDPTRAAFRRAAQRIGESLLDATRPGASNEAMMELGATVCTPRNPDCAACPIATNCVAHTLDDPTTLPEPKPRKAPRQQTRRCAVVRRGDEVWMRRADQALLGGLFEVPTPDELNDLNLAWQDCGAVSHLFSHIEMRYEVFTASLSGEMPPEHAGEWVPHCSLDNQPISTAMRKVIAAAS